MKLIPALFVLLTILCWGTYVPVVHQAQGEFGAGRGPLRAFLFVALAYALLALGILLLLMIGKMEPMVFQRRGVTLGTLSGVAGAMGALGVIFALRFGGNPLLVAPLVFAGAPVVNTIVSMLWHRPAEKPSVMFYMGIVLAACGAGLVLGFKPK